MLKKYAEKWKNTQDHYLNQLKERNEKIAALKRVVDAYRRHDGCINALCEEELCIYGNCKGYYKGFKWRDE